MLSFPIISLLWTNPFEVQLKSFGPYGVWVTWMERGGIHQQKWKAFLLAEKQNNALNPTKRHFWRWQRGLLNFVFQMDLDRLWAPEAMRFPLCHIQYVQLVYLKNPVHYDYIQPLSQEKILICLNNVLSFAGFSESILMFTGMHCVHSVRRSAQIINRS